MPSGARIRPLIAAIALSVAYGGCAMGGAVSASEQRRYPPSSDTEPPIHKTYKGGLPLTEKINIIMQGVHFRIPVGYFYAGPFWYRIPKEFEHQPWVTKGIAIQYWFPSLRYVERRLVGSEGNQPLEAGRPPPGQNDFVIKVGLVHISGSPSDYRKTSRSALNIIDNIKNVTRVIRLTEEYGLIQHASVHADDTNSRLYYLDDDQYKLVIRCSPRKSSARFPSCSASVYLNQRNMGMNITFPTQLLPRWRDVIESARRLFDRYKVEG